MRTGIRTGAKSPTKRRHVVKKLAAMGLSGDVIAAHVGLNKNTLRARHALDLHAGREIKKAKKEAAAAAALSKEDQKLLDCIKKSFASHWYDPELGNLIFGDTHSVAEAWEWCKRNRGRQD
jgi:hypothetical protein